MFFIVYILGFIIYILISIDNAIEAENNQLLVNWLDFDNLCNELINLLVKILPD